MIPPHHQLFLEVVDLEMYTELEPKLSPSGKIVSYTNIDGSETAFLILRGPDGTGFRVEIPYKRIDEVLAFMYPEDYYPTKSATSEASDLLI